MEIKIKQIPEKPINTCDGCLFHEVDDCREVFTTECRNNHTIWVFDDSLDLKDENNSQSQKDNKVEP